MDTAIITGADTPLGRDLVESLVRMGCRVHGIGNNFSNFDFADKNFRAHAIDPADLDALRSALEGILDEEQALHILIHAIDVTPGTPFEKLAVGNLEAVLKVGLLGPVLISRLALPNLIRFRGRLINVLTANKSGHPASALNGLIENGLRGMNQALLDTARDRGLRLTNVILRQNEGIDASADATRQKQSRIDRTHLTRLIERLLSEEDPNLASEIVLHPRTGAAAESLPATPLPVDPYARVVLPPKDYFPPEPEKIATKTPDRVERNIPYTDEELEDRIASAIEEFESRADTEEPAHRPSGQSKPSPDSEGGDSGKRSSRRRRRRRGGRNRDRNREGEDKSGKDSRPAEASGRAKDAAGAVRENKPDAPAKPGPEQKAKKPGGGKRGGGEGDRQKPAPKKKATAKKKPAVKKTAAKKATKKATKKTTKRTTKKAAKKPASKDG